MCLLPAGKRSGLSHRLCQPGLPGGHNLWDRLLPSPHPPVPTKIFRTRNHPPILSGILVKDKKKGGPFHG